MPRKRHKPEEIVAKLRRCSRQPSPRGQLRNPGHAPAGAETVAKLTFHLDHPKGADHFISRMASNSTAVVFVVVENALPDDAVAGVDPAVKPFDRGSSGWVRVTPCKAEIVYQ